MSSNGRAEQEERHGDDEQSTLLGEPGDSKDDVESAGGSGGRLVQHEARWRIMVPMMLLMFTTSIIDSLLMKRVAIGAPPSAGPSESLWRVPARKARVQAAHAPRDGTREHK